MKQKMEIVSLELVESRQDIKRNLKIFNRDAIKYQHRAYNLIRQTTYWAKDNDTHKFAPSKFIGFQSMNFDDYETATKHKYIGVEFNGNLTRTRIEKVLGLKYVKDFGLLEELIAWGEAHFGNGVFNGLKQSKWKFIVLP
jgi:hypothetical protein